MEEENTKVSESLKWEKIGNIEQLMMIRRDKEKEKMKKKIVRAYDTT